MKFEDFLMKPPHDENRRSCDLKLDVVIHQREELKQEQRQNKASQCGARGPVVCRHCLSYLLPYAQVLLAELAMVEEEIVWLERKVENMKTSLHKKKKHSTQWELRPNEARILCKPGRKAEHEGLRQSLWPKYEEEYRKFMMERERKTYPINTYSPVSSEEAAEKSRGRSRIQIQGKTYTEGEKSFQKPNEISQQFIKSLMGIFLGLNNSQASPENGGSGNVSKLSLSCMNSKGFRPKASFICNSPAFLFYENAYPDPYGIFSDFDGTGRDIGPYKNFIQITRSSLADARVSKILPAMENLRVLMLKLCDVDLTSLTYKQKLAFWINIYNACIMHAFLQHGLPSTHEKLQAFMSKAVLNVGGLVLNALAIEHYILRHPCDSKLETSDDKGMQLRHAYGLRYPEPNVTFALCRGSWSSPSLRVYTPDEVVNELERAKVEYLEASVGITSKKKIILPKILQWHMRDFADDIESLLEWIYSQLPHSGSLKRLMIEFLNGGTKFPIAKMVEVLPYESEFRYLIPYCENKGLK